ncbi:MAG: DUF938 domain-containing protein [Bacteriovoracaceae bacterium]|jgi:cyclopropane fatty-acyl-phospholipid synthase-like methyltransferase|nr:DUF938 domain-containing protein [Bacteriovoracaceae bacterium]
MNKPFAPSCERNKDAILKILKQYITSDDHRLLEVGSGSGQHAVHFAPEFKDLQWVTSDVKSNHDGIKQWLKSARIPNIHGPLDFELGVDEFPRQIFNLVFTANTFHILSWKQDKSLMKMFGNRLREGSQVFIYGPFNYDGKYTSKSNEDFDMWLKDQDSKSAIRNFEDVNSCMVKNGFKLTADHEMPANNRMLVYTRLEFVK